MLGNRCYTGVGLLASFLVCYALWFTFLFGRDLSVCRYFFLFQAEDGIRDWSATGVQTCALPICTTFGQGVNLALDGSPLSSGISGSADRIDGDNLSGRLTLRHRFARRGRNVSAELNAGRNDRVEIGRASCRERG